MKKFLSILFVFALCMTPIVGWSQDNEQADDEKDALEVSLSAGLGMPFSGVTTWHDSLGAKNGLSGSLHVGYFLTSNVVIGAQFSYTRFGIDSDIDDLDKLNHKHQVYYPGVYVKYHHFGSSSFVPFVEGNIGADFVKFSTLMSIGTKSLYREAGYEPGLGVGLAAGVHYYTSDMGGVFVQAGYHHGFTENLTKTYGGNEYKFGENLEQFTLSAGIQVFFGSGD